MPLKSHLSGATLLPLCLLMASACSAAAVAATPGPELTSRIVVKFKNEDRARALSASAEDSVRRHTVQPVAALRRMASGAAIFKLEKAVPAQEAQAIAARIAADPTVEYAVADIWVKPSQAQPSLLDLSDPYAKQQWSLANANAGGADFLNAWNWSKGRNVLVAVIDTGHVEHPDVASNTLRGYDFIDGSSTEGLAIAGDGNGRDADPTDPGDFCASRSEDSSWHGLRVAGTIAALADNGMGVAGGAPLAQVLQVRALGRCGGYMSDVADALVWSVGGTIQGLPVNPSPAHVVNLSLGSTGPSCPAYMRDAVAEATKRNVPVIAAAGNDAAGVLASPANCAGVIAVGAHTMSGDLATYSNRAVGMTLTAPGGGNCQRQTTTCGTQPTLSLSNNGKTIVGGNVDADWFAGTSAAAPQVAAAVALLRSVNMALTPAEVATLLKSTSKPHAADSHCVANPGVCGAGMLDTAALVAAANTPTLSIASSVSEALVESGQPVSLKAAVANAAASSYAWAQVSGASVALVNPSSDTLTFTTPALKGDLVFRATVTLASGASLTKTVTVTVNNKPRFTSTSIRGVAGAALSIAVPVQELDAEAMSLTLVLGPPGVTVSAGKVQWAAPVAGTYPLLITAQDSAGQTTTGAVELVVDAATQSGGGTAKPAVGGADIGLVGLLGLAMGAMRGRRHRR